MLSAMETPANPSALHTPGHLAMNQIEAARAEIAKLINAEPEEIIFTSGGTESNNTVINIFSGQPVLISSIEHPSIIEPAKALTSVNFIPVNKQGIIDYKAFTKLLVEKKTALVSIMLANNEIGTIEHDLKNFVDLAHQHGALFHTDATQALGKIPIDVKSLGADYMTLSSHKIGGPVGIGVLYVKKNSPFRALMLGGHQEKGRRAGTYQTVNISGFGAAAKYANKHQTWKTYEQTIRPLRDRLAAEILEKVPHSSINTPLDKTLSLPHILNCSFEAAEGESIQLYLDAEGGIIVSTGSACASGDGKPSHVLMAIKNDAEVAHSSIRFSLGLFTTSSDIDHIMKYLPNIVKRLQGISTIQLKKQKENR